MLEEHIVPFLQFLEERRYSRMSRQVCRAVTQEFTIYLEGRVQSPEEISTDHLRGYLGIRAKLFPHFWRRPMLPDYQERLAAGLTTFLRYLAARGIRTGIPFFEKQDLRAVPGYEELLAEYERFLRDHRGLQPETIATYLDHAARLCRWMVECRTRSWDDLSRRSSTITSAPRPKPWDTSASGMLKARSARSSDSSASLGSAPKIWTST